MSKLRQILGGYLWWTSPRGSVPYDIMVTLILAFIFLAPLAINFGDKPTVRSPHQTEMVVRPDGNGFLYKVDAAAVNEGSDRRFASRCCACWSRFPARSPSTITRRCATANTKSSLTRSGPIAENRSMSGQQPRPCGSVNY